ncbi:uncharacterized protein LOC113236167 [Hyposmocoma kahamanoa]|uniref:uncharacterized protein LOC113236167 n=1 Tax=Hyposmocoma kahamanoa TaxID=1477025 RepID=UPI000E6D8470|nr:uncharacterized protein LOC113236167 [Hyposmocoma kahamanoa]
MFNTSSHLVAHLINNGTFKHVKVSPNATSTTTTENPKKFMATITPNKTETAMYSKKDFLKRRKLRQLEEMITSPSVLQEYLNNVDFDTLTRRFDAIPLTRRKEPYPTKPPRKPGKSLEERENEKREKVIYHRDPFRPSWAWNYDYPYFMNGYKYTLEKNKTIQIMHSIVHEVRYKLVFPQLLRKKYHKSIRYRLGYLFSMLRHLQRQSRLVYHELEIMVGLYVTLYPTMRLLDKISRLATDIRDIIKLIRQYELERKMVVDPHYYDFFPSSRAPKWRRADPKIKKRKNFNLEEMKTLQKKIELQRLKLRV